MDVPKPPDEVLEGIVEGATRDWDELVGNIWTLATRSTVSALLQVPGFEEWLDGHAEPISVPIEISSQAVPGAYEWVNALALNRMAKLAQAYEANEHEEEISAE